MLMRLAATGLACAIACLPARAQTTDAPPTTGTTSTTTTTTTTATTTPPAITSPEDAAAGTGDRVPPSVTDITIASDNPAAAPVISANVNDDVGVVSAVCWWRTPSSTWQQSPLAGSGTFRLVRLPDGVQTSGFDAYVEVTDAAGNIGTAGTRGSPMSVGPAVEGNAIRLKKNEADARATVGPHPAWIMLSLGVGVAAGAGAGIFGYDLALTRTRLDRIEDQIGDDPTPQRRAELEDTQAALRKVETQDTAAAAILGVVGAVSLTAGVVLLVMAVAAQE